VAQRPALQTFPWERRNYGLRTSRGACRCCQGWTKSGSWDGFRELGCPLQSGAGRNSGPIGDRRGSPLERFARTVDRGVAGDRREGKQGPRARCPAQFPVPVPHPAHHRQSRTGRPSQGGWALRPADRARGPGRLWAAAEASLGYLRICRGAGAERRGAAHSRCAPHRLGSGEGRENPGRTGRQRGRSCPSGLCAGAGCEDASRRVRSPQRQLLAVAGGGPAGNSRAFRRAGPGGCAGSAPRQAGPGSRGQRGAQSAAGGAARHGKIHAGRSAPEHPAANAGRGSTRSGRHRIGEPPGAAAPSLAAQAFPVSPSHRFGGGIGRRRQQSQPRRGLTGSPRRTVPRRAARVRSPRARSPARAAGDRSNHHLPRFAAGGLPG
jgi:hypothetical protein